MGGVIGALHDATVRPLQLAMTRMAADAAAVLGIALLATLGVGFAIAAACVWLAEQMGALAACGILAGVFLGLAGFVFVVHRAAQAKRQRKADQEAARRQASQASAGMAALIGTQLVRMIAGAGAKDRVVLSLARTLARRSNPWILLAVAVAGGFAGARMLGGDEDSDASS